MNVFTNYLEKYGSNFIVAAMVPALAVVVASLIVFEPILQIAALFKQQNSIYRFVGFGLFIFILTVIIGFTLTALNTYILKFYEGLAFFHRIPFMHRRMLRSHRRNARILVRRREILKRRIEVLENSFEKTERTKSELERLQQRYYDVTATYDHAYPQNLNEILPTQFGNILRASESYPGARYGMDGVEFWPRLLHVVPLDYRTTIDSSRNELSFLVNMSILSLGFYLLSILAMFYALGTPPDTLAGMELFISVISESLRYLSAAGIAFACSVFFYKASIYSVSSFGMMIRSAYDLFRTDLLKQLRLKIPSNSWDEFYTWQDINEFLVLGTHSLTFKRLDYETKQESPPKA